MKLTKVAILSGKVESSHSIITTELRARPSSQQISELRCRFSQQLTRRTGIPHPLD
jgi:hypothetical protein